jgi:hypothetical protein
MAHSPNIGRIRPSLAEEAVIGGARTGVIVATAMHEWSAAASPVGRALRSVDSRT